ISSPSSLFQTYPAYQDLFAAIRGIKPEDLKTSKKVAAHGLVFMSSIETLVENLEDKETLEELLRKIAVRHNTFGLLVPDYKKVTGLFLEYFLARPEVEKLETPVDFLRESWQSMFDSAVSVIGQHVEPGP
ncbi:unnamed protein product, partial [Darwinula stevensoni]